MYTVNSIIGNTNRDESLAVAAETHEKAGTLERVLLDAGDRKKSRLRVHTEAGTDLGILVDKPELEDGDVLYHDDDRLILVSFEEREALTIDLPADTAPTTLLELGHRVGNQHWDLAVEDGMAYVPVEADRHIVEDVLAGALPDDAELDYEFVDPSLFLEGEPNPDHSHGEDHSHSHDSETDHDHSHEHPEDHNHD
ncbi:urease accessory protein UreE [Natranaeroarchaeum aerophilus]|uniref:Urease accessory protein UreE n=1 Tax=Natranaeroarchaeum aerophilus TaxID=2917711 RepID=A0AAE3FQ95_9EURY|nr:urease accessory protein UreE [Natranaeroarchaeum aerophilus]MCL9813353.1 urease accessory protein UreE [Natranaeroarchaeum aerophilus]